MLCRPNVKAHKKWRWNLSKKSCLQRKSLTAAWSSWKGFFVPSTWKLLLIPIFLTFCLRWFCLWNFLSEHLKKLWNQLKENVHFRQNLVSIFFATSTAVRIFVLLFQKFLKNDQSFIILFWYSATEKSRQGFEVRKKTFSFINLNCFQNL